MFLREDYCCRFAMDVVDLENARYKLVKVKLLVHTVCILVAAVLDERYQLFIKPRVNIPEFLLDHREVVARLADVVEPIQRVHDY